MLKFRSKTKNRQGICIQIRLDHLEDRFLQEYEYNEEICKCFRIRVSTLSCISYKGCTHKQEFLYSSWKKGDNKSWSGNHATQSGLKSNYIMADVYILLDCIDDRYIREFKLKDGGYGASMWVEILPLGFTDNNNNTFVVLQRGLNNNKLKFTRELGRGTNAKFSK